MNDFAKEMRRREARADLLLEDDRRLEAEDHIMEDSRFAEDLYDTYPEQMGRLIVHSMRSDIPHSNYVDSGQHQRDTQLVQDFIRRWLELDVADMVAMGE